MEYTPNSLHTNADVSAPEAAPRKSSAQDLHGNMALQGALPETSSPEAQEFGEWCAAAEGMLSADALECSFAAGQTPAISPEAFRLQQQQKAQRADGERPSIRTKHGPIVDAVHPSEALLRELQHVNVITSGGPLAAIPHIYDGVRRDHGANIDPEQTRRTAATLGAGWKVFEAGAMQASGKTSRHPEKAGERNKPFRLNTPATTSRPVD